MTSPACRCDERTAARCEMGSGRCICKPQFTGANCDRCADGHYYYPQCIRTIFLPFFACFLFFAFIFIQIPHWCLKMMSNFSVSCLWIDWHESFLGLLQQQPAFKPCIVSLSGSYVFSQRLDFCCNLTGVSLVRIMSHRHRHRQAQCTFEEVLLLCSALEATFIWPAATSLPSHFSNTCKKDAFVNPLHV